MWEFLVKVLEFIGDVQWKKLWTEITNMPKPLKIALVMSLIIGIVYFTYQKSTTSYNINTLQEDVKELNTKVNKSVRNDNYRAHFVQFVKIMQNLENQQYYYYLQNQQQLKVWKRSIIHNHPNDPILYDIDAMLERNRTEYMMMFQEYRESMRRLGVDVNPKEPGMRDEEEIIQDTFVEKQNEPLENVK